MAKHFLMGDFFTPTESAILSMKYFVPNTSSNLALTVVMKDSGCPRAMRGIAARVQPP